MFLVAWIVLGVAVGLIISKVIHDGRPGFAADVVLGMFGAVIGGFVFNVLEPRGMSASSLWSLLPAAMGAVAMLVGFHGLRRTGLGV